VAIQLGIEMPSFLTPNVIKSNVSMPNKKKVIPYLDKLDKTSKMCDAVNTIVNATHGVLTGYTTDGMGWLRALKKDGQDVKGKIITLAGAGGAATPIAVTASLGRG
jgi:shikimate dehydrogenase